MAYIYQIINDINDKIYVGKTEFSIEKRFKEHCADAFRERNEKRPLYSAMRKYGIEHFHIELIEETDNPEEKEIYWIEHLGSFKHGYNATVGGDGKKYLDYELIISMYNQGLTQKSIAEKLNCDTSSIRAVLRKTGFSTLDRYKRCGQYQNKIVHMINIKTNKIEKSFSSMAEAYRWLEKPKSSHIKEVCEGKRKTAYGYKWKFG